MGKLIIKIIIILVIIAIGCEVSTMGMEDYKIKPVPFNHVQLSDNFWLKRITTNKNVTIPKAFGFCESTGRINNFKIAGGMMNGKFQSGAAFDDSDVYKIIEGAAYSLVSMPDPKLEAYMDSLIYFISKAQESDGYLYTYRTIMGDIDNKRWEMDHAYSHELYNLGHLYEAGIAYYQATGKKSLLEVCLKSADLVAKVFGWNALKSYPGHQEIEIGLVKLYRLTSDKKYLDLAKFFLDVRGNCDLPGSTYSQSHIPVVKQNDAVGHCVRALYMYSGMTDVAVLTGDERYITACKKLWDDIVKTKLYITGGVGFAGGNEGFGSKYELPNSSAYCETCAAIANVFWNHRLFLMEGDAKYIDVLERSLYNNVLSGVALSGDRFFYPNPLETFYGIRRSEWFGCACCPSNICRFIPSVPGYIYAVEDNNLYVNLYIGSKVNAVVEGNSIDLEQSSNMPWEGCVSIKVNPREDCRFTIKVRIPGWARNEAVPYNDLYWFKDKSKNKTVVKVNGKVVNMGLDKGYVSINREWRKGDIINVEFPMDIHKIQCNENVKGNREKVALQRGPIVYCAEGLDFPDNSVMDLVLSDDIFLDSRFEKGSFDGIVTLYGKLLKAQRINDGSVKLVKGVDFRAIPYYAWAHRTLTPMTTWFATRKDVAKPKPAPSIANLSEVNGSLVNRGIEAIRDQILPISSNDHDCPYFHWWPHKDKTEWISYTFNKQYKISRSKIYWFSDGGGCKAPKEWRLYYKEDDKWIEVKNRNDEYGVRLNVLNTTIFEPVTTSAVKIEIELPKDSSTGIYEWIIE